MVEKSEVGEVTPQPSSSETALEITASLQAAIAGLQWISESEYPFKTVDWSESAVADLTNEKLLELTQHPLTTPVETQDLDSFFELATQQQDWHNAQEIETVHQYRSLVQTLKQHLRDLKVYKIGMVNLDIYIIGKTSSGALMGLATQSVET